MMRTMYQEKNNSVYICLRLYKMNNVLNIKRPEWVHATHMSSHGISMYMPNIS